jgi:spermidine synthase
VATAKPKLDTHRAPLLSARQRALLALFHALFFLSGAAGLGYQLLWSKMFAAGLGHEMPAILAVVCAFMGGMALGAGALDRVVSHSSFPGRWYGGLELIIGAWGFVTAALIPEVNELATRLIGLNPSPLRHWAIAFAIPFLVLLPATAGMGATLPAIERFVALRSETRKCVGGLYAANTFGAVAGILLTTFLIAPRLGFRRAAACLAAANILCGVIALALAREQSGRREEAGGESIASSASLRRRLQIAMFGAGLFGIGYEVVGVRVLAQVLENTIYTFAETLAIYLLGASLGAAIYQRRLQREQRIAILKWLLWGLALATALGIVALSQSQSLYDFCRDRLGDSAAAVFFAEIIVAATVFALPTVFMGATFSHLAQNLRRAKDGVGIGAALNTFGGALAVVLFVVVLVPAMGTKWTLASIAIGYAVMCAAILKSYWGLAVASAALLVAVPANLRLVRVATSERVADYREGAMSSVAVLEDTTGQRTLRVDGRFQMGGTAAAAAEYRHAHIPLLLHSNPKRALFLGLGTGITIGAATVHPDLRSDGVELVPEVVKVMGAFEPQNFSPARQTNVAIYTADARRFVRASDSKYDVIVADLFHPARDGAGSLYTVEHFEAIRGRLHPDGLFCQWLPLYQLDEEMLRVITRTFLDVFPEAQAWLLQFNVDTPVLGLIGGMKPRPYDPKWIERRIATPALDAELKKLALADSVRFFGCFLADAERLRAFVGSATQNTDDLPRVTFAAPHFVYRKDATSYGRLLTLLEFFGRDQPPDLNVTESVESRAFLGRLAQYWRARNVYLQGLVADARSNRGKAIDDFVESAKLSEDFTPGYAQCLTIASLRAKSDPDAAAALLRRLIEAQPDRSIAREMLRRLSTIGEK